MTPQRFMLSGIPLFPEQASTIAPAVDNLYVFVTAVAAFLALLVAVLVTIFAIKYRDRTGERIGASIHGSILLEIGWSIIPFLISLVIFTWAAVVFFQIENIKSLPSIGQPAAAARAGAAPPATVQGTDDARVRAGSSSQNPR